MTGNIDTTRGESLAQRAARYAMLTGAIAGTHQVAQAQATAQAADALNEIVVTGTRVRRVDAETASPVLTVDAAMIERSGVATIGDLLQKIPAIAGAASNPQVNNGGGTGESNIELRGLGAQRTLVLLNGRRVGIYGNSTTSAVDVNIIPINLIERVDVLKEGAGAIYGSDAIAGVVNFVTKKKWDGADVSVQYGRTGRGDGASTAASASMGTTTDKLSVLIGANYNRQDAVSANNRDFSRYALYLYSGSVQKGGSSRIPTGRVNLPAAQNAQYGGCSSVTRKAGAAGSALTDYRCFSAPADLYNYQPLNLLMTPQERGSLFTLANYQINDSLEAYLETMYNRTQSGYQIAALPFDAVADDVVISAQNMYNPFGIDFGGISGANPNLRLRLESVGPRHSRVVSNSTVFNTGLRGEVLDTGWQWDLNVGAGHLDQDQVVDGYYLKSLITPGAGPSFMGAGGVPTCGTPSAPIAGCTPLNFFNAQTASAIAGFASIATGYHTNYTYASRDYSLNLNGKVLSLPAGDLLAAVGAEYRYQEGTFTVDGLTRAVGPDYLTCQISQEACTGDSFAKYSTKEYYGELFAPLLKDLPGVHSLNASLGVRSSNYSTDSIGSKTTSTFKIEYRPIADVLVRGSYATVFRAPTINDLSLAPSQTNPTFTDPCTDITSAAVAANPNLGLACVGVPRNVGFSQPNSQISALLVGNQNLKPETGTVLTYGVVYDSSFVRGLSANLDVWRYKIDNLITSIDPNFAMDQCVSTGNPFFCGLISRYDLTSPSAGEVRVFRLPNVNLGTLETNGIDLGVKYALGGTPIGKFNFSVDLTRIQSYKSTPAPGATPVEVAGTYDRQFGNFAKWRGMASVGWAYNDIDALLSARYVSSATLLHADGALGDAGPDLPIASFTYVDLTVGYTFPTKTRVQLGGINLTDKAPPILYQNNVLNANTDVSTYDSLGRRFFLSVSQKF